MKKLNKLKLNDLVNKELSDRQMKEVRGGGYDGWCTCSCYWAGSGGSSTVDNCKANTAGGYSSSQGDNHARCRYYTN